MVVAMNYELNKFSRTSSPAIAAWPAVEEGVVRSSGGMDGWRERGMRQPGQENNTMADAKTANTALRN